MPTRLAIVTTHPIQYQVPLWRSLAQDPDLDLHVYFGSDFSVRGYCDPGFGVSVRWDVPLTEGYAHTFLSSSENLRTLRANGLREHVRRFRPDLALICGYNPSFYVHALTVLRSLRVPVMIRAETTDVARERSRAKALARAAFLRAFYSQCVGFLAIGHNSRMHYLGHGVPPARIGWAPYCIDTELFGRQVEAYGPQRSALRHELGFGDDQTVILYVGKLIPVKDPLLIPAALARMDTAERSGVGLVVVGDGELREAMENQCRSLLGDRAVFAGFVNQNHLGRYYAMADCLVLPSQTNETWGLVVNEALQFGLPALVSDGVGCHPDLIVPEKTGLVFRRCDPEALLAAMRQIRELLSRGRKAMTGACQEQVSRYSSFVAVEGICHAVKLFKGIQAQQRSIAS